MQIGRQVDELLLLSLDLLLTVQFLLFELVLQQFNLLQLRVELQLEVVDDVAEMSRLILKLFIFDFESHYPFGVMKTLLNCLLELLLNLFQLVFILHGLFFVDLLIFLGPLELGLGLGERFLCLLYSLLQIIFGLFEFFFVLVHDH